MDIFYRTPPDYGKYWLKLHQIMDNFGQNYTYYGYLVRTTPDNG